ncbi:MAG: RidA family protein [Acidobacteriia bacterium]|nr:RidA family protein [Terriglobia bacterium]
MRETVRTDRAPAAVGPYSQAVRARGTVWVSGQIPLDPATGAIVPGDVETEARQALRNVGAILEAAGSGLDRVVKTTVYLTDLDDFERVNRVYAELVPSPPPARVCVEVSRLPRGARVEIDAVALVD